MIGATVASERAYGLAEGPVWDPERERILWVDINRGDVHIGSLRDSFMEPAARVSFEETVGAVVCAQDGRLNAARAIPPGASSSAAWRLTSARARSACTGWTPTGRWR